MAWARVAGVLLVRPALWVTALRQLKRLTPSGWWRRWPFLPVPSAPYRRMRLVTQYGDEGHPPDARDVLHYMVWCRQWQTGAR